MSQSGLYCFAPNVMIGMTNKKKKSKKETARATLANVMKEMAQPRFAESARKEEEANHPMQRTDARKGVVAPI